MTDHYSELSEALGCDAMDSHLSRVARARKLKTKAEHYESSWGRCSQDCARMQTQRDEARKEVERLRAALAEWEKLRDPVTLHANLLRGQPAQLSREAFAHLAGDAQQSGEPVAGLDPTHIYDFAGWLTSRPGLLQAGSAYEAGPMAEAVNEYLRTFPERFAAPQQRKPLTLDQIDEILPHEPGDLDIVIVRAVEHFHGIKDAP
jgi:hypothetical protein